MTTVSASAREHVVHPDWAEPSTWLPQLAAHLHAAEPGALHLDATGGDVPATVLQEVVLAACARLAPGVALPELILHDDPDELAAHGDLPAAPAHAAPPAATVGEAVERARAVKRIADEARDRIERWRFERASAPTPTEPLVTVRVPTWRGHELLVRRALPSVLNGGYRNVEVLVCSDGPDPLARAAVEELARRDPRLRYLELPERPVYPQTKINLHRVGGVHAINRALDEARGDVICPLDHDDAFTYDHIAQLLDAHVRTGSDFVYGQSVCEMEHGVWAMNGSAPLRHGSLSHGSVLYSARLAHLRYDPEAWLLREPGDWNLFRRMGQAGAAATLVPATVLVHFGERSSIDCRDTIPPQATPAEELADLRAGTGAWLLRVPLAPAA